MHFVLYTRRGCHLCELAEDLLAVHGVACDVVDVDADAVTRDRFGLRVPVLEGDGRVLLEGRFDEPGVAAVASAAAAGYRQP